MKNRQLIEDIRLFIKSEAFKNHQLLPIHSLEDTDLVFAFNSVLSKIYRYQEESKIYHESMMHELRGLLTGVYFYAHVFEKSVFSEEKDKIFFNEIIERTKLISEKAILFSSLEDVNDWYWEKIDLAVLLINEIGEVSYHQYHDYLWLNLMSISIQGNPCALHFAIQNLILNALDACDSEKPIWVRSYAREDKAVLMIQDQGMGLSQTYKKNVYRKFLHSAKGDSKGFGTGLFLTKKITELHQGEMRIDESDTGSLSISLIFPLIS